MFAELPNTSRRSAGSPGTLPTTTTPVFTPIRTPRRTKLPSEVGNFCSSDSGGDRERGAHRAFGIVFVRLRHAEICQQSVANHSGDVATVLGNLLVADIAIGSDNCEEFLGIDLLTQRRRSDDVDKCHGKLSAFGVQNLDLDIRQRPCPLRSARLARFRLARSRCHHVQFLPYLPRSKIHCKPHPVDAAERSVLRRAVPRD